MNMFKALLITLICLALSGCATLHLVSFGVSALSYSFTGKSVTDHVISQVTSQDCALHRLALGQQACLAPTQDYIAVLNSPNPLKADNKWRLNAFNSQAIEQPVSTQAVPPTNVNQPDTAAPAVTLKAITQFTAVGFNNQRLEPLETKPLQSITSRTDQFYDRLIPADEIPELYAVVGTFIQQSYAKIRRKEYQKHQPQLLKTGKFYQVVIGPFTLTEYEKFAALKHEEAPWRIRLCEDLTHAPCQATMLAKR